MDGSLPKVTGSGIFDSRRKFAGKTVTVMRTVEDYELELFFADGGISHINDSISAPIFKGTILLARPGDRRRSVLHIRCHFIHFICRDDELCKMIDSIPRIIEGMDFEKYEPRFRRIASAILSADEYSGIPVAGELITLLYDIYNDHKFSAAVRDSSSNAVLQARRYIEDNFSAPITAGEIAKACGLSESYLYRVFSHAMGVTPHNYLLGKRLTAAKEALISSDLPLSRIAEQCGFQSQAYFCCCFKNETGMSPGEFRHSVDYPD
jgi:AraC-like DNA-binding protein